MPFEAKVFKILIASPGDVEEERQAIPEVISRWNDANAESNHVVLLPVKWETHSAPLLGDRAQAIVNKQLVASCDMAIGVFWTRLGSPTGVSQSGTAEEIEWFIGNQRPVMVYFSSRSIDPAKLDIDQFRAVKDFETRLQKIGLTGSYNSLTDFKEKLLAQITINVKTLMAGQPVVHPTEEEVKEKTASLQKIINEGRVYMEDYEKDGQVKSFVVKGDTKRIKDELKMRGGRWNRSLGGWIFPKAKELDIASYLKEANQ